MAGGSSKSPALQPTDDEEAVGYIQRRFADIIKLSIHKAKWTRLLVGYRNPTFIP